MIMVVLKFSTILMVILNLISFSKNFQTQMVNFFLRNKKQGSIDVIKTTEVIFMVNQTKKETFSNNMVKNMNNFNVLIVHQPQSTLDYLFQSMSNIPKLRSVAVQIKLTARIAMRLMSISKGSPLFWNMPITHRPTNLESMVMQKS